MSKLQKQLSRKTEKKKYVKWVIVIPADKIKKAELNEGDELLVDSEKDKIILQKITKPSAKKF